MAVAAVAGVVAARAAPLPAAAWLAVAAVAAAAWRGRRGWRLVAAIAGVAAALAAREGARRGTPDGVDDRGVDVIEGWVAGPRTALPGATAMVVEAAIGPVWVTVDGAPAVWPGDRVRVTGRLRAPRGFRNPGSPDRAQVARDRGVRWELRASAIAVLAAGDRASGWRWPMQVARAATVAIARRGGDPVGNALVRAVVVGDRSGVPPATDDAWRAAGVYHALSVSGLHLAVVALAAFVALTWLGAAIGPLARRVAPRRAAAACALPIAIGYTLVTGGQVATVRALVVVVVMLVGELVERRARLGDALGLAALAAIAWRPSVVWDPAFELSFVAAITLAAVAAAPHLDDAPPRWRRALAWLGQAIRASWCVTVATAPITAWHFGQVSFGGVIGNLIVGPAFELVTLPLAVVGTALALAAPAVGGVVLDAAIAMAGWIAWAVARLAPLTPTLRVRAPTPLELAACAALYLAWLAARRGVWRRAVAVVTLAAIATLAGSWRAHRPGRGGDALTATFLDVGQGDAAVLEFPDGQVWLIDAGGAPGTGGAAQLAPGRAVAAFLRARGIAAIDVAVVSHPHPDHYLGLIAVAAEVPIRALWMAAPAARDDDDPMAGAGPGRRSFAAVAAALASTGTRIVTPRLAPLTVGDVTVEVLAPGARGSGAVATGDPVWTVNDSSLVLRVTRAGQALLFAGDVEEEGEAALIADGAVAATVVKVPHHGSPTSSSPGLVAATHPRWAIVSLGRGNRFGFPAPAVIARWRAVGARVLRTDEVGAITVTVDRAGRVAVATFDPPPPAAPPDETSPPGETPPPPRVIMAP